MAGVCPAIRVRIDQCREKKSYINIYYVDKSIDKSSLSRARAVSLCFSPPRIPNLPEQPQTFALPLGIYRHPSHLGGRGWGAVGLRWGWVGGRGVLTRGPTLVPARLRKLEVGVSVLDGLPRLQERRLVRRRLAGGR